MLTPQVRDSDKFGTCTVVSVNGTLVEDKMRRFKGECEHFIFNNCPFHTHDGASAKFSTNSHEKDNSVGRNNSVLTSLFPPRESLVLTSRLGTGNSRTFFYGVLHIYISHLFCRDGGVKFL